MSEIISSRKWQNNDGQSLEVAIIENEITIELGNESISLPLESAKEVVFELRKLIDSLEGGN